MAGDTTASTSCAEPAGSPAPGVVEVDGVRHTADHVVLANGADPVVPPVPGLRELDGIWTNREATGMKEVPRRLLVLGGGPVGVEMAQAVRRFGGEVALVEGAEHLLPREPAPLGEALGEVLRRDGIELALGVHATAARREGDDYVLELDDGSASFAATGCSSPPAGARASTGSAWRPSASKPTAAAFRSTRACSAGERLWAIGDVTGIWQLTHVGKYQGEVVAANILGEPREANYEAVPRVVYTDPQAAAVGATEAGSARPPPWQRSRRPPTYTRAYAESNGFLTLLSDGERLTGAYALGPEAGEWLQQATLAIRARVPLDVLRDTIQPFPTFSEIYVDALKALRATRSRPRDSRSSGEIRVDASARRAARADRRRDRRQRRHRARDGPAGPRRGRRGHPHRPRPRAPGAGRDRTRRAAAPRPSTPPTRRARTVLRGPAGTDRPRDGHRPAARYYAPLADIDVDEARRASKRTSGCARGRPHAAGKVRPGGHAALHGRHRRPPPGAGLAFIAASRPRCPR